MTSLTGISSYDGGNLKGKKVFVGVPPYHAADQFRVLAMATYCDMIPVSGPITPLTAEVVDQIHTLGDVKVTTLAPAIVEDIATTPEYLQNLRRQIRRGKNAR